MRIAILAHSTNPRGGVVHALALGEALTALGHEAVVHAPDPVGAGFFRTAACGTVSVPAGASHRMPLHRMVETRVADYVRHFEQPVNRAFDVFHAHDGLSGNALAALKAHGLIRGFVRTVHHIDGFADARVAALQNRSIVAADRHFTVSRMWRDTLMRDFGLSATVVGNGVDLKVFTPRADGREAVLRARLCPGDGPAFLAVGGVEERKNTLRILQAFAQVLAIRPDAQLVVAGGASLLDHGGYQAEFRKALGADRRTADRVVLAGPMEQADMPALYRIADALVFPSVKEGFGLVALEAMACGTPVLTSRIPPFTEHFGDDDVIWCNPHAAGSIADAMVTALAPAIRRRLSARADAAVAAHRWDRVAAAHLPVYQEIWENAHA